MSLRWVWASFLSAQFLTINLVIAKTTQISSFSPTGAVKGVQQVVVKFSSDMKALGDSRSPVNPMMMECLNKSSLPKYVTRWIDTRSWALEFDRPLSSGVRCVFKVRPGLKDIQNNFVETSQNYSFSTSGPALLGVYPMYQEIEPDQYFVVLTEGGVNSQSVEKVAHFEVEGLPGRVDTFVVTKPGDRDQVLRVAVKSNWAWKNFDQLLKSTKKAPSQLKEFDDFLILSAVRRFPEKTKVVLHWPKGILSSAGLPVEEAQKFEFSVISPFEAKFTCERVSAERACNPILDMRLHFSRPISQELLRGAYLSSRDGKIWKPYEFSPQEEEHRRRTRDQKLHALTFKAPFPELTQFVISLPRQLRDELHRPLINQSKFPLSVSTDEFLPLVKFPAPFGILESVGEPVLPVNARNVEEQLSVRQVAYEGRSTNFRNIKDILTWFRRVRERQYDYQERDRPLLGKKEGVEFKIPKPGGAREFEVFGIPLKKSGFHVVEIESPKLGSALLGGGSMYVSTSVLVTDLAVHLKKGRENSIVWVTRLSTSQPVAGAQINIVDGEGREISKGLTDKSGIWKSSFLEYPCSWESPSAHQGCEIFAFAKKEDDISFASSEWTKGIEGFRFNTPMEYLTKDWGPSIFHTIFDRTVSRPGDNIQMKHVLRESTAEGFRSVNSSRLPKSVSIIHEGSQKIYTLPFDYDEKTGTALSKFEVPKGAALGTYGVYLSQDTEMSRRLTGQFTVAEFRLPLMTTQVLVQGQPLTQPRHVNLDLSGSYLSGGPARHLKVKLRANLLGEVAFPKGPGLRDFNFFSRPVKPGVVSETGEQNSGGFLDVQELKLGLDGGALATIKSLPKLEKATNLSVEMEYVDPNGEYKTSTISVPVYPSDFSVGLKSSSWFSTKGKGPEVEGVVLDHDGRATPHRSFVVEAFQFNYFTHRKRIVGGFYAYDSRTEVLGLGKVCEGRSDSEGRFKCNPKNLPSGQVTLQARVIDDKGYSSYASTHVSVYDNDSEAWWSPSDDNRIDILPEKEIFDPNESARLVLRSPYVSATALVTVEREGILDSFITEVRRENPVIVVPLKGSYAPNVFISALLVRGRVGEPKTTALLDLARPSMKMGLVEIKVGWKAHDLQVNVTTDKKKYSPREKIQATVRVVRSKDLSPIKNGEVAIVAVDEALLKLKENLSWKLLSAMMGQRFLSVSTSSGQNQVIGKRHFGSKTKTPGGGGGLYTESARDSFEPVLYWQPRVRLNSVGEAKVTIPLNDSVTSFRLVAVAQSEMDFFGDGSTQIESSKDLTVFSGLPPLMREGDEVFPVITVRNTTPQKMMVDLYVKSPELGNLVVNSPQELKPNEGRTIPLSFKVPRGVGKVNFEIKAQDRNSGALDRLVTNVKIEPVVSPRVQQAMLFQIAASDSANSSRPSKVVPVTQPRDAIAGSGGLRIDIGSTLSTAATSVKSYMRGNIYDSIEQKISRSISIDDRAETLKLIEVLPLYLDVDGLVKFFPTTTCGSPLLTRYLGHILGENNFEIPTATKDHMVKGMLSYLNGKSNCRPWVEQDFRHRFRLEEKILLLEALSRYKVFEPSHLSGVEATPNLWKNETLVAWIQLLQRETSILDHKKSRDHAERILRSRVNVQGSVLTLQGESDIEGRWRLFTSSDQEAMGVLSVALSSESWSEDVGKITRGLIARLTRGHWDTSMANAWGITKLKQFSMKFEKSKVTGTTTVSMAVKDAAVTMKREIQWTENSQGAQNFMDWPKETSQVSANLMFSHEGGGRPWILLETLSAIPLKLARDAGYGVSRKIFPVVQVKPGSWHTGDVARVEITIVARSDQPWVVVSDSIPTGASHLGTGLEGESKLLNSSPETGESQSHSSVQNWPAEHQERSQSSFTSYAAYLRRGTYKVNYRLRLNSAGTFNIPPTRVEAMYFKEAFGELPNGTWSVER